MSQILNIFILITVINYKVALATTNGSIKILSPLYEPCGESKTEVHNMLESNEMYPWVAAIMYDNKFLCDGTLVTNKKIVSAAHCFLGKDLTEKQADEIIVVLGAKNLENLDEVGRVKAEVKNIHIHRNWNPIAERFDSDIAVLMLNEEVTFNNFIQPVCMTKTPRILTDINDGVITRFEPNEYQLVRTNTQIQKPNDCFNEFPKLLHIGSHRTICVGNSNGTNECTGNRGAGLTVVNNGRHFLRGIASTSLYTAENQCDAESYAIFTDLRFYLMFVKNLQ